MAINFKGLSAYQKKFYVKDNWSKNFTELSEEELEGLSLYVYIMQEKMGNTLPYGFERYEKTLEFLTNRLVHLDLETFDERVAYLIMMTDPNLVIFKEFLKLDLPSITEIDSIEDEKEKTRLKEARRHVIQAYESSVRKKIGFFDSKLLKYEEMFFMRFFNEHELITEVGCNNLDSLMTRAKSLKDFNTISDERYEELVEVAQTWLSLVPEKYNSKVAAYSVTKQSKLLGLKTLPEQLAILVLLIDSDLDMLRIYEEESRMIDVEERIIEQFGFFNVNLLVLERKFHERFCPEKQLSVWTKIKKD